MSFKNYVTVGVGGYVLLRQIVAENVGDGGVCCIN